MPRKTPARDQAREWLLRLIDAPDCTPDTRLPRLADLARRAGVSPVTMQRAVRRLQREGRLKVSHGRGIRVAGTHAQTPADQTPPPSPRASSPGSAHRSRRHAVAAQLKQDLLEGAWGPDTRLPSKKELAYRYGVCYRTIRQALDALAEEGRIRYENRAWCVVRNTAGGGGNTLILFARLDSHQRAMAARTVERYREFEAACARRGLELSIVPVAGTGPHGEPFDRVLHRVRRGDTCVLGFMVWSEGLQKIDMGGMIRALLDTGRPVAVLDEADLHPFDMPLSPRCAVLSFAHHQAGSTIANHLLELGHRRFVFISPYHATQWSQQRLQGIIDAYDSAGVHDAVTTCTYRRSDWRDAVLRQENMIDADLERLERQCYAGDHRVQALGRALRSQRDRIRDAWAWQLYAEAFSDVLTEAFRETEATAWVAVNDDVALRCRTSLEQRGRRVPGDISLCGFDNTLEAHSHSLTSYDFNARALIDAMVAHVLYPRGSDWGGGRRATPVHGHLAMRASTGRTSVVR